MSRHQLILLPGKQFRISRLCFRKKLFCIFSFVVFFLLASLQNVFAQQATQTEEKEIYLRIYYVLRRNDTLVVLLENADKLGIKSRTLIKGWQSYKDEVAGKSPKREMREVGSGMMIRTDSIFGGFIKLYNSSDSMNAGDMVALKIEVPVRPVHSVIAELAFRNIIFYDKDDKPLYRLQDFTGAYKNSLQDSVFQHILSDLAKTSDWARALEKPSKEVKEKVKGGRFKDRYPLDIMKELSAKDLEAFLLYAYAYPVGYQAKKFKFSHSFLGWLTVNSPCSPQEIKNALLPIYKNKPLFSKQILLYKRNIVSEETVLSLIHTEVTPLLNNGRYKEALELSDFLVAISKAAGDTAGLPWAYLMRAQVSLDQLKYQETISICEQALQAARIAKDIDVEVQATIKKGFCFFRLSRYKESDSMFRLGMWLMEPYKNAKNNSLYTTNARKVFEYRSTIYKRNGDYALSMLYLDSAIMINKLVNSYDANVKNAEYYKVKGEIINEQGKPSDALEPFNEALAIHKNNRDKKNQAYLENSICDCYFSMGDYRTCIDYARRASDKLLLEKDFNNSGYSWSMIGQAYWNLGKYDSAVIAHRQAIDYRKQSANRSGIAWSFEKIGELFTLSGRKKQALESFDSSIAYYRSVSDSAGIGDVLNLVGRVFLNDENYKKAVDYYERARKVSNKTTVEGLYNLGQAWVNLDTAKSRSYFEQCRALSIKTANINYQFYAAGRLARFAYDKKNFPAGNNFYKECIMLRDQMKTEESVAGCLSLKAYYFDNRIQLDSALFYYDSAASVFNRVNKSEEIYCLNNIANIYISTGEFSKSDLAYQKAIDLARISSDQMALAYSYSASSFLYGRTGEFEKGLRNSDSAFAIYRNSGNNIRLAGAWFTKATVLGSIGEFKKAIEANLKADSIYQQELIADQRSVIYNNIGVVYRNQKDYQSALKNFDLSLKLARKGIIDESYLLVQGNRAECLHYLKKSKEAEALLLQILPQTIKLNLNRIASGMAITMGNIYFDLNKLQEAKEYFTNGLNYARKSGEKEKVVETFTWLGRINNIFKQAGEAENNFRQAIIVAEEMNGGHDWECYYELGLIQFASSRFDSAASNFKKAVDRLEKNIENLFGGESAKKIFNNDPRKADLYNKITYAYFKLNDIDRAWEYANRYNLAGLKELTGSLSLNTQDKERNEALKKLFAMQKELQMLQNTADKQDGENKALTLQKKQIKESEYSNFLDNIVGKYNDLGIYFNEVHARNLKNYKKPIPDDMALLLYIQNDKTLMIISLTREKLAIDTIAVDPSAEVSSYIDLIKNGLLSVRGGTVDDLIKKTKDLSHKIYQMLIAPIDDSVKAKKRLCIIPTGIYSNMPFQCLGNYRSPGEFHYLIEDHVIFYATDASSVAKKVEASAIKDDLVSFAAFGVPDEKLVFNLGEVQNIGKIVGSDSTIYADQRATKSKAIESLQQKKVIHFATHGYLTYTSDLSKSYLKLVAGEDDDGMLTIKEIGSLGIEDCNMVILSACQTAVTKTLTKGWNISPANSFLLNNVRSVVASLWKVSDEPTGILMEQFYNNLKSMDIMDKTEALRQAQLALMKDPRFTHPNFWGAFALYGDWR
jgi:CHAT domain-containing protein